MNWCQFDPEVFAALIGRLEDPKTTLLTFTSANNVCTGAKSETKSRIACRVMVSIMQDHGIQVCMKDFKVQNIVASAYTGFPLKLEQIAVRYSPDASYRPEVFPGLIFRMVNIKVVFLLFRQGKLVITGGKKRSQITSAANIFYNTVLLPFRDDSNTINYVPPPQIRVDVADVVKALVEEYGKGEEMGEVAESVEDQEDLKDMRSIENSLADYQKLYESQMNKTTI